MTSDPKSGSTYSAPKLFIYGDMAKLTASGSGSMNEVKGNTPPTKKL